MSSIESVASPQAAATSPSHNVVLSPFVNERFPAWEELLSAHDVARLTRRPRWVLAGLAFFGQFPRKRCYHGRRIGWLRGEVLGWIGKRSSVTEGRAPLLRPRFARHEGTEACPARRSREPCATRERGGR